MKNRSSSTIFAMILSVLACFAFLPQMQAAPEVVPGPDGCYPGFTTAEGCNALNFLTTGAGNTGLGWYALFSDTTGSFNTGVGAGALVLNVGVDNTAVGTAALLLNTSDDNTAVGTDALVNNTTGDRNCAFGSFALFSNQVAGNASNAFGFEALFNNDSDSAGTGVFNNAFGWEALFSNVDGFWNTAMGDFAGGGITGNLNSAFGADALSNCTGDSNTGLGSFAGSTAGASSNTIFIGANAGTAVTWDSSNIISIGVTNDSSVFGTAANTCYINYIFGEPAIAGVPQAVFVDSDGVMGFNGSSRRYKHDIKPMDKASETLFALKPVTFKYNTDKKNTLCFGLIAEEVAEANPDLVLNDSSGRVSSVRYEQINVMLLNEFLKEHKRVEEQQASISQLKSEMQTMVAQLKEQAAQIQKVSAQLEVNKPAPQVVVNKP
ncbi:MAG: hypothetical protein DME33_07915 [Verrucomicrobia bacterium]|nr:MAG: hypothetical protein DME33_07915 [Verrucomicrobiota bacterium]